MSDRAASEALTPDQALKRRLVSAIMSNQGNIAATCAAIEALIEEARREEPWTRVSDSQPPPHARYEVKREATGIFVATPCYGMHLPWWVPLTADLYASGTVAFPMENSDEWRSWPIGSRARGDTTLPADSGKRLDEVRLEGWNAGVEAMRAAAVEELKLQSCRCGKRIRALPAPTIGAREEGKG